MKQEKYSHIYICVIIHTYICIYVFIYVCKSFNVNIYVLIDMYVCADAFFWVSCLILKGNVFVTKLLLFNQCL